MLRLSTDELIKKLVKREDIITVRIEGFEKIEINDLTVAGPAVILIHRGSEV
ncbi:BC1881 family protein [Bacillus toyonensis]|uniref:BC1881 family protein n=1 Tax=Bacillus toyonensis TaxID=155322 RepID=UPI0018A153CB|nr:BC1881 family protein [Bacillus toyonensis]MBF7150026.1 BC1881 family protein [Bacillus toyonensis]MEC2349164.1 BC1881 family protein [Bacillus toyonensis]MED3189680.1 BC1881 family protein [Bacillus toyonensis]